MSAETYSAATYSFPVVILGGGFAGAYCARALSADLGQAAADAVALVADQNVILFHPMLAEVSGSSISPLHVVNPLRGFCRGASVFRGVIEDVDLEAQTVRFSPGRFVPSATLHFEHLLLALGGVVEVSRVPGMPERKAIPLLALNKATFEALAQNSLALGYLLSRSAVEYLTLEERKAIVDRISATLRNQRVADFMRVDPVVVRETDSVGSALKTFQQAAAFLLPVVDEAQRCKGWLRLEFVFDLLHQGKARVESPVHHLLILPFIGVKPDERVEQALLRFAQTADREFAVESGEGRLIGTLALLDLVLAEETAAEPSARELALR